MNTRLAARRLWLPMFALTLVFVLCLMRLAVPSTSAQTTTKGIMDGTISDASGAAVPGVTVTATRQDGGTVSATTNDEGFFRLTNLEPGTYTVTIEAGNGFAKYEQPNVTVNLSRPTSLTLQLRPASASASEAITVTQEPATATTPTAKASSTMNGGLQTVTFDTSQGQVRVNLPDDMRAGDTISGTVAAEPKGQTEEERNRNSETLKSHIVEIEGTRAPVSGGTFQLKIPVGVSVGDSNPDAPPELPKFIIAVITPQSVKPLGEITIEMQPILVPQQPPPPGDPPSVSTPLMITTPADSLPKAPSSATGANNFQLPTIGQQGRLLEIFGPFDGNASNTTLKFGPPNSTVQDFEKGTENVSGGFGLIRPLAESPRKIVFEAPSNITGPVRLFVNDGGQTATGPYNNLGVKLSAPKTNLMRGEKTTVTIQVSGLQGIKKEVPLQLDSKGVITMEGGSFQNLRIKPSEVTPEGRYTTNRGITGQQAGGFNVTATVIVRRFDFSLQDDADPNRIFHFNSFTGDYIFACGGGSCRPGGSTGGTQTPDKPGETTLPGGTGPPPIVPPPPVTLTGLGKMQMKGCIITLSHNAPDRRVFARLDACTKSGDASVETTSPKTNFNITDKNTTDNPVASPPK